MPPVCSVLKCRTSKDSKEVSIHRFSSDKHRCEKQRRLCGNPELYKKSCESLHKTHFICGLHYPDNKRNRGKSGRMCLISKEILPSLNLPRSQPDAQQQEVGAGSSLQQNVPTFLQRAEKGCPQLQSKTSEKKRILFPENVVQGSMLPPPVPPASHIPAREHLESYVIRSGCQRTKVAKFVSMPGVKTYLLDNQGAAGTTAAANDGEKKIESTPACYEVPQQPMETNSETEGYYAAEPDIGTCVQGQDDIKRLYFAQTQSIAGPESQASLQGQTTYEKFPLSGCATYELLPRHADEAHE